jgi:hypothetical protein
VGYAIDVLHPLARSQFPEGPDPVSAESEDGP